MVTSGSDLLSRLKQVWSMSRASIFRLRSSLNFSCTCATRRNTISTLHIAHIFLVGQHVSLLLDLKIIMNPCACNCTCPIRRSVPCMSSWCWDQLKCCKCIGFIVAIVCQNSAHTQRQSNVWKIWFNNQCCDQQNPTSQPVPYSFGFVGFQQVLHSVLPDMIKWSTRIKSV